MESSKTKKKTKEEVMGMGANKKVEYMCSYCGTKQTKPATAGRPPTWKLSSESEK